MKTWRNMVKDLAGRDLLECIKCTFLVGILAHGMALFNKLAWRNDLFHGFVYRTSKTIALGRWMRALLAWLLGKFFNDTHLSVPPVYGAVTMLFIALGAHVILRMFDIRRKSLRMTLCAMMVAFPVVTSTFGFMYDAPYYFFGMLLAVLAVYIAVCRPSWDGFIASTLCVCACLAIYQAYFPVAVSLFVIRLIFEIAGDEYESLGKAVLRGVYFLAICALGMVLFFASWKIIMKVLGVSATGWQGTSSIGKSGFGAYVRAVGTAYKRFLLHFGDATENLYPMRLVWIQRLLILASGVSGLVILVRHFRKNAILAVLMAVLMAILPLCFNLIYVLAASSPSKSVHVYSLMLYAQCMLYVFLICAIDRMLKFEDGGVKWTRKFCRASVAMLALMIGLNVYLDNSCYVKATFELQQSISDLTVMLTRIKSLDGYNDQLPLCVVMDGEKDDSMTHNTAMRDIQIVPYDWIYPYHHGRDIADYFKRWLGYHPDYVDQTEFIDREEVKQMPIYPDDGSIKIIDGTVVVRW